MAQKGNFYEAIPLISLYAFVGYRLMPALQSIYVCVTNLSFIEPSLNSIKILLPFTLTSSLIKS